MEVVDVGAGREVGRDREAALTAQLVGLGERPFEGASTRAVEVVER